MADKTAATLTIHRAAEMNAAGKREIAKWLRKQANFLVNHGEEFSTRFTARYLHNDGEE